MVRHSTARIYNGKRVAPGDPVEGTQAQQQALLEAGQAYREEIAPSMDNTKKEIESYLQAKGISYESSATKQELIELI